MKEVLPSKQHVLRICTAYESGFGRGQSGRDPAQPYADGCDEAEAYTLGYQRAKKIAPLIRSSDETKPTREELLELLSALPDFVIDFDGHVPGDHALRLAERAGLPSNTEAWEAVKKRAGLTSPVETNAPRCAVCDHIEALHDQAGKASHSFTPVEATENRESRLPAGEHEANRPVALLDHRFVPHSTDSKRCQLCPFAKSAHRDPRDCVHRLHVDYCHECQEHLRQLKASGVNSCKAEGGDKCDCTPAEIQQCRSAMNGSALREEK